MADRWGAIGVQLTTGIAFFAAPKIVGTSDGNAVVAWTSDSDVVLQKLDGSGVPQWAAGHVQVYDGASSLQFGAFPSFVSDDSGGAIFSWYITSPLQCLVQHVASSGLEVFPHNGKGLALVPLSATGVSQVRALRATGGAVAAWAETVASQTNPSVPRGWT